MTAMLHLQHKFSWRPFSLSLVLVSSHSTHHHHCILCSANLSCLWSCPNICALLWTPQECQNPACTRAQFESFPWWHCYHASLCESISAGFVLQQAPETGDAVNNVEVHHASFLGACAFKHTGHICLWPVMFTFRALRATCRWCSFGASARSPAEILSPFSKGPWLSR